MTPRRFVHGQTYADDPSAGGELIGDAWADPATFEARWVESDAIVTRNVVACDYSTAGCAEYRLRSRDTESDPSADDEFVRYRGTSPDDARIEEAGELRGMAASAARATPDGSGPVGDVTFPWQTLPPNGEAPDDERRRRDVVEIVADPGDVDAPVRGNGEVAVAAVVAHVLEQHDMPANLGRR